jgi:endonuclease III
LKRELLFNEVLSRFRENNPGAATELHYRNPYELLVAVILSAQCTDKRVNIITPPLFSKYPDAISLAEASEEELFSLIKSCSYPNNKTKSLLGMARMLAGQFGGSVPDDVDLLQQMPGVGRKTANVIASVVFDRPAMAVDTHVFRVAARIGLTTGAKTPLAAEQQLVRYIPEEDIARAHHWLILHGRYICKARKPVCSECFLMDLCKYFKSL